MRAKVSDWMVGCVKNNVLAAVATAATPAAEYATGMTMMQILSTAVSTVAPVLKTLPVVTAFAYKASTRHADNLQQQESIQETINELNQKKAKIEDQIDHIKNPQGNKKDRQKFKRLKSELDNIDLDIQIAEEQFKAAGSSMPVQYLAGAYDAVSSVIGTGIRNITDTYQQRGLMSATHEAAKYLNNVPGMPVYVKAGIQIASGNVLDGAIEGTLEAVVGVKFDVGENVIKAMATATTKEIKNAITGGLSTIMTKPEEEPEIDLRP